MAKKTLKFWILLFHKYQWLGHWEKLILATWVKSGHPYQQPSARGDQSGMDLEGIRRPDASGASRLEVAQPL